MFAFTSKAVFIRGLVKSFINQTDNKVHGKQNTCTQVTSKDSFIYPKVKRCPPPELQKPKQMPKKPKRKRINITGITNINVFFCNIKYKVRYKANKFDLLLKRICNSKLSHKAERHANWAVKYIGRNSKSNLFMKFNTNALEQTCLGSFYTSCCAEIKVFVKHSTFIYLFIFQESTS